MYVHRNITKLLTHELFLSFLSVCAKFRIFFYDLIFVPPFIVLLSLAENFMHKHIFLICRKQQQDQLLCCTRVYCIAFGIVWHGAGAKKISKYCLCHTFNVCDFCTFPCHLAYNLNNRKKYVNFFLSPKKEVFFRLVLFVRFVGYFYCLNVCTLHFWLVRILYAWHLLLFQRCLYSPCDRTHKTYVHCSTR